MRLFQNIAYRRLTILLLIIPMFFTGYHVALVHAIAPRKSNSHQFVSQPPRREEPKKGTGHLFKKSAGKKAILLPRRGPLQERASCHVQGHTGHVENAYTAMKKWIASYCVFLVGSVPQEKTFSKESPDSLLNALTLPHGWLSLHNAHTQDSLCINIFTDQACPQNWDVPMLLASSTPPPWPAQAGVNGKEQSSEGLSTLDPSSPQPPDEPTQPQATYALPPDAPREPLPADEPSAPNSGGSEKPEGEESTDQDQAEETAQADLLQKAFGGFTTDQFIETDLPPIHPEAQRSIDYVFRHHKNPEHQQSIYPRTLIVLSLVFEHFQKTIELYSGHRFQPRTTSRHFGGRAADITIPGVKIENVRSFLLHVGNRALGIGLYVMQNFLHVDSRDRPFYCFTEQRVLLRSATRSVRKRPGSSHTFKRI